AVRRLPERPGVRPATVRRDPAGGRGPGRTGGGRLQTVRRPAAGGARGVPGRGAGRAVDGEGGRGEGRPIGRRLLRRLARRVGLTAAGPPPGRVTAPAGPAAPALRGGGRRRHRLHLLRGVPEPGPVSRRVEVDDDTPAVAVLARLAEHLQQAGADPL